MKNYKAIQLTEAEQFVREFDVYLPEIVPTIEKYINSKYTGGYYDHNVMPELQKMAIFSEWSYNTLKHYAYTTTSFVRDAQELEAGVQREARMLANGYTKVTPETISTIERGKFYEVVSTGTNFIGADVLVTTKLKLYDAGERGLFWIKSANSSKGMPVWKADFIKLITKK